MPVVRDFTALPAFGWNAIQGDPLPVGRPLLLTFSFPDAPFPALTGTWGAQIASTFSPLREDERAVFRAEFQKMADICGLTLIEVAGAGGDIKIAYVDLTSHPDPVYAKAGGVSRVGMETPFYRSNGTVYPSSNVYWETKGFYLDAFGDITANTLYRSSPGNAATQIIGLAQHEGGHSFGLKHPFDVVPSNANTLATDLDRWSNTVLSYTNDIRPDKIGSLDIQALQYLYGTNDKDGSQFSSWNFDRKSEIFFLNFTAANDQIRGTDVRDVIDAGAGNDLIYTGNGNDTIIGGTGSDTVGGGFGTDTFIIGYASNVAKITKYDYGIIHLDGPEGTEITVDIDRFQFTDKIIAYDGNGSAGQTYRLYQAAFARTPDKAGLSFWVDRVDDGSTLRDVASGFIASAEFKTAYGNSPSSEQYVGKFYQNVLGRSGEASGVAYWSGELKRGVSLAEVMLGFAESAENVSRLASIIGQGIELDPQYFV